MGGEQQFGMGVGKQGNKLGGNKRITRHGGGVVYYSVGRDQKGVTWNEKLHEKRESDIAELKQQGKRIALLGDFNGHIGEVNEQGQVLQADQQGNKLRDVWGRCGLLPANRMDICKGKWTRMSGTSKSEIDFVLIQEE